MKKVLLWRADSAQMIQTGQSDDLISLRPLRLLLAIFALKGSP
jgi:hypothetical protein